MDSRGVDRVSTNDVVQFRIGDVEGEGRMLDLSTHGCKLNCGLDEDLTGQRIDITLFEDVFAHGKITRASDGVLGIEFVVPLSEVTVKFFRLGDWGTMRDSEPRDGFGRSLPPLPLGTRRNGGR